MTGGKRIKAEHDDVVIVCAANSYYGQVLLELDTSESGDDSFVFLTKKQNRKLRKALKRAAKVASQ